MFDLIEEYRAPFVDRLLLAMLGRGMDLRSRRAGMLRTRVRRSLAAAFRRHWSKPRLFRSRRLAAGQILTNQIRAWVALLEGRGSYHPYRMKW